MLFKPWNEAPAPRHALVDNEEESSDVPIPEVRVELKENTDAVGHILVLPESLSPLSSAIEHSEVVGNLVLDYPQLKDLKKDVDEEKEYDEDEQLYKAIQHKIADVNYKEVKIPISRFGKNNFEITVPYFANDLIYNLIAREVTKVLNDKVSKSWIVLAPCEMGFTQTVCQLEVNSNFKTEIIKSIPPLNPPHYITGVSASVCSRLSLISDSKVMPLALKAEGQPGFEKTDSDSFVDAAYALKQVIPELDDNYVKRVSNTVRKINSSSYSGMYI